MVARTWTEFEAIANEREIGRETERQPRQGETWVAKYPSDADVLAEWRRRHADDEDRAPEPAPIDLDALTAALPAVEMF